MSSNDHKSFRTHRWQIAGVVIACVTLIWSIGWNMYVRSTQGNDVGRSVLTNTMQNPPTATSGPISFAFTHAATSTPVRTTNGTGCYSISCDGQTPEANGCIADQTLKSGMPIYQGKVLVATVEFYVSRTCAAGWVNIETPRNVTGNLSAEINNGAYIQQYCYPQCPVQRNPQAGRQNVHTVMIHTNQNYHLWGRGCYFPEGGVALCFPNEDTGEFDFEGFWP